VNVEPLVFGELTIDARTQPDAIDLFWRGRSLERHPAATIVPYVTEILASAKQQGKLVRMHFETIELMNSSTITAVIHVIREARTHSTPLEIRYDATMDWQRLSFHALSVLVHDDGLLKLVGVQK
jgi:hypothetical protein